MAVHTNTCVNADDAFVQHSLPMHVCMTCFPNCNLSVLEKYTICLSMGAYRSGSIGMGKHQKFYTSAFFLPLAAHVPEALSLL